VIPSSGEKQQQLEAEKLLTTNADPGLNYKRRSSNGTNMIYAEMVLYVSNAFSSQIDEVRESVVKQIFHPCMMHVSTMPIRRHGSSSFSSLVITGCCLLEDQPLAQS
jgi:hypothetical protein